MKAACLVAALALLGGCATPVAPYQRGYLARPGMEFDASAGATRALEKTFGAKEASSGGARVGGGGCGCS